ncbi:SDR family NAD(P)-dependent oxidoreductase [Nitrogeniibacter aestuarii]|uniref:SDR family NAD(P)-dependent oxidoreductase n=1 Tax=Nitrogeniibacter aestuarii TaxID=2815343 RepID=UPI001D11A0CB|nr:SDR family oxidoreductase [Nitrogeniibacter aestuarii]
MKIELSDKFAIVTGSTRGIGFAIAQGLAAAGAHVVINGRTAAQVDDALDRLKGADDKAKVDGFAGDLGAVEGCAALVERFPHCDVLVNNLGIYGPQDFFETDDATWQHFFDVNVMSAVRLSRAYAPGMQKAGWGRIVMIASESAINIPSDMIHYGFTKTAMLSIARGLAKRMAGTGVTVNSVLPGPTLSEGLADMLADDVAQSGRLLEDVAADFVMDARPSSVIQRAATCEEVANMVVYACSKQASATTGAALRVDGGVVDSI